MIKYKFKTKPRDHQLDALKVGWNKTFFAYLMGRGTGKTKVTLDNAAILYEQDKIDALLVIAPNEVHDRWITEQIPIHLPDRININTFIWPLLKKENPLEKGGLVILAMNIEALQYIKGKDFSRKFCRAHRTMVVIDESTRIKTPGIKRTRNITYLNKISSYRRILTGNETTTSPFNLYAPFKFLYSSFWNCNYTQFKEHYGEWIKQYARTKRCKNETPCSECKKIIRPLVVRFYNNKTRKWDVSFTCPDCKRKIKSANPKVTAEAKRIKKAEGLYEFPVLKNYKNLPELRHKISKHSFRVRKRDCLDLPEKIYDPIYAKLNKKQEEIYNELKDKLFVEYEGHELTVLNKLSIWLRFQQIVGGFFPTDEEELIFIGSPKMDRLLYDLEGNDNDAVIIWAAFVAEIKLIANTLQSAFPKDRTATFYGGTKKKDRSRIIDDFQEGKIRFLVANPEVGGVGLNLQRSNLHYYYSNSYKPEPRWQSEDRSHRDGQHWPVVYKDIFIKGTVDDNIKKSRERNVAIAEFFKDNNIEDLI